VSELGKNIMIVYQDTKNNYWFGSNIDGVYKFDGKTIIHFTTKDGLTSNRIDEIKEDKSGNIYFTTGKGIAKFNGQHFKTLDETIGNENDWKLSSNELWFKSSDYSGFVYRYDGKTLFKLQLPKIKIGEDYISKNPNTPTPYAVYYVYKDSKDNVWFGTGALGALRYNGKTFNWISEKDVAEIFNNPNEGSNGVRSIIEDKNGDFWFNSEYHYTIYNNRQDNGTFYNRIKSIGNLDGNDNSNLSEYLSITKDNNNDLWIATYSAGVWKYDGIKITHYPIQINSKDITVFSIYTDKQGNIWLGTHDNGALKFNGQTFEPFKI
jgi:ligand-binding sensor domain-containing protein